MSKEIEELKQQLLKETVAKQQWYEAYIKEKEKNKELENADLTYVISENNMKDSKMENLENYIFKLESDIEELSGLYNNDDVQSLLNQIDKLTNECEKLQKENKKLLEE